MCVCVCTRDCVCMCVCAFSFLSSSSFFFFGGGGGLFIVNGMSPLPPIYENVVGVGGIVSIFHFPRFKLTNGMSAHCLC